MSYTIALKLISQIYRCEMDRVRKHGESRSNQYCNNQFSRCITCKRNVMARKGTRLGSCYERDRISSRETGAEQCKKEIEIARSREEGGAKKFIPGVSNSFRANEGDSILLTLGRTSKINFPKARKHVVYTVNTRNDRFGRHLLLLNLVRSGVVFEWVFRNFCVTWLQLQS